MSLVKKPLHKHLMIRANVVNPPRSPEKVIEWLKIFVESLDMKILQGPFCSYVDQPGNRGLTAVVMIETSHIAFHLWDEHDPALLQFDIYTCGSLDSKKTIKDMSSFFNIKYLEYLYYDRENHFELLEHHFELQKNDDK